MSAEPNETPMTNGLSSSEDPEAAGVFPAAFGQYALLHRLARGGMGNVYLAKTGGMMGIEKHCVVKTLRGQFTHDQEYVERFMEEARVVVQLSHRNICPVFDVGRVGDSYYLAMELIIGRDVRRLTMALEERGALLPEECALHVSCEMLDALDYAHRHADNTTGVPLHLVHRDISPQNVMISLEGEVKLIDFGLAERGREISDERHTTGSRTVMGKMSYMSPEQARGEIVDARADQFAAAVVAYELVSGRRYYDGLTPRQVWEQAGAGLFKPSGLAELDPELRQVLEIALAPDKENRFPSTGDFRDALLAYARRRNLHAGARELRAMMNELLVDELREIRELLQKFAHVSARNLSATGSADETLDEMVKPSDVVSIARSDAKPIHDPTEMFRVSPGAPLPAPRAPLLPALIGVVLLVVIGAGLVLAWAATRPPPPMSALTKAVPGATGPSAPDGPGTPSSSAGDATTTTPGATGPASTGRTTPPATASTPQPGPSGDPVRLRSDGRDDGGRRKSSSSSGGGAAHKSPQPEPRKKPETLTQFMPWLKANCPKATCTKDVLGKCENFALLSLEQSKECLAKARTCYDSCH